MGRMYEAVLIAHALWRWVVIAGGIGAISMAVRGLRRGAPWAEGAGRAGRLFGHAVDLQFLMGASLYLVFSPVTNVAMQVSDGLPEGSELRFFGIYHGLIMTAVFIAVHVSAVIIRRGRTDATRHRLSIVLYGATLFTILCTIPWWRPLFRI